MLRIGVVGWGAIGQGVGEALAAGAAPEARLCAVLRRPASASRAPAPEGVGLHTDLESFLGADLDCVLEAGGGECLRLIGERVLERGATLVVMSTAALAEEGFRNRLIAAARRGGAKILAPSGALAGLDAVSAAAVGGLSRVALTQSKPPAALLPEAEAATLSEPKQLAALSIREAGAQFPKNANIAVGLGLAAGDLDAAQARIVADPRLARNCVEYEVEGAFGRLTVRLESEPSANQRTSQMAIYSALAALRRASEPLVIGA
ncbi:MAG: aspartate dehydrogenase domain-containing protein [Pseudomonadota bacterium]